VSVSLDFLKILGRRKKNKISQGGVWADLTPPFVTLRMAPFDRPDSISKPSCTICELFDV